MQAERYLLYFPSHSHSLFDLHRLLCFIRRRLQRSQVIQTDLHILILIFRFRRRSRNRASSIESSSIMVRKRKTKPKTVSGICKGEDKISGLSDDLLVKILSFLPTKDAVSTSILSKRWECLWMWLPKLKYYCGFKSLSCFLNLNLPLHRAPVIESFHLGNCASSFKPEDVRLWVVIALSRHLRKLKITHCCNKPNILPSSLYTNNSLVTLKLRGKIRLDVPRLGCLPSLKTLQLLIDDYLKGESLRRLLSICPVLEDLLVYCDRDIDDVGVITVTVPSLQRLSLNLPSESGDVYDGLVINTPSLKYLKLEDLEEGGRPTCSIENMPNLEEAYVDVRYPQISSLIGSIISVKRLTICSEIVYSDGFVFNQLEHLTLCVCPMNPSKLLTRLLEDSPNLRVLDIFEMDHYDLHWKNPPSSVDECILSSLQAFNWSRYLERRPQEKDLAIYILGKQWSLIDCNNSLFVSQSLEISDSDNDSDSDSD